MVFRDEEISGAVEKVSFEDTLGELRKVFKEALSEGRTVPVSSVEIYKVIADFGKRVGSNWMARVDTKYKSRHPCWRAARRG